MCVDKIAYNLLLSDESVIVITEFDGSRSISVGLGFRSIRLIVSDSSTIRSSTMSMSEVQADL